MTAVDAAHVVPVPVGHWRSIDRDRRYRPFSTSRSLVHSTGTGAVIGFRDSLWVFFGHKTLYAKLRRELVRGWTFCLSDQLETFLETIEQELRPAVC